MNPDNKRPDLRVEVGNQEEYLFTSDIARRLPMTLRVIAVLFAAVGVISLLLIKERNMSQMDRKSLVHSMVSKEREQPVHCPDLKTAMKTSSFYILALYSFTSYCFVGFMLIQYKNYAMTKSKNDQLLSLIGSVGFVCNTITRFLISVLMDYIAFRRVSIVVMTTQIVLAGTVHWIVAQPLIYMIWVSLAFICFAAVFSPVTIVCGDIYGPT
jgi:nitrate/nitrite transporter NarK